MKKLLIILSIISLSACTTNSIKKSNLPIEVVNLKITNKYDTLLTIETNESYYLFNKKEYVGKINKEMTEGFGLFLLAFLIGALITAIMFIISQIN